MATAPAPAPASSAGTANAMMIGGAVLSSYASGQLGQAAAINQQTGALLQARDNLAIAEVRADYSEQYASIQAGRTLKRAEVEATNYKIAGNQLLKNLRATNAANRARAAANGVQLGSGSIDAIQRENTAATMRDVDMAELNALTARVFGFEDASGMMESSQIQNIMDMYAARAGSRQMELAGSSAVKNAGLLANAKLIDAGVTALRTVKT
jgi:hypothetical protein